MMFKLCLGCAEEKSKDSFHKNKSSKDGLAYRCKDCVKKYSKAYYEKNSSLLKEKSARWKAENPEKNHAQIQAWRKRNRDWVKFYSKTYQENNSTTLNVYAARWRESNRDAAAQYASEYRAKNIVKVKAWNANRRAREKNADCFLITQKEITKLYDSPCYLCGTTVNISADHAIPLARGGRHSVGNLIPLCIRCNSSKKDKTITEYKLYKTRLKGNDG